MFGKKSIEELAAEQEILKAKIGELQEKAKAVRQLRDMQKKISEQKQELKQLEKESSNSLYRRIRSHTSPVLKGIENKVKKKFSAIKKAVMKVSEMGAKVQKGMTQQSEQKEAKLW